MSQHYQNGSTLGRGAKRDKCPFCGGEEFQSRREEYLYSHKGEHLLVSDFPVEICAACGMRFYPGAALLEVERHFFAIQSHEEEPDKILQIPCKTFA
ncbi:MAG: YgiT-type zinc finger protein [Verrucomicrobiota bacterium]|nr:YgiT-type zinc finger protein [Verrucomicrobiota bacterium]